MLFLCYLILLKSGCFCVLFHEIFFLSFIFLVHHSTNVSKLSLPSAHIFCPFKRTDSNNISTSTSNSNNNNLKTSEMDHVIKVLATMPDDLSSIPGSLWGRRKPIPTSCPLTSATFTHLPWHTHTPHKQMQLKTTTTKHTIFNTKDQHLPWFLGFHHTLDSSFLALYPLCYTSILDS